MPDIGVRELKTHASEIVRRVKEKGLPYIVTHHGRPVAAIVPVDEVPAEAQNAASAWDELVSIGEQIAQGWQSDKSSTELLSDMRR